MVPKTSQTQTTKSRGKAEPTVKLKRALRRLGIHNLISATGSGVLTVTLTVSTPEPVAEMRPIPDDNDEMGAQWLSGRVLDSRPKGSGFEPHRRHCVVVLEQDTFILA